MKSCVEKLFKVQCGLHVSTTMKFPSHSRGELNTIFYMLAKNKTFYRHGVHKQKGACAMSQVLLTGVAARATLTYLYSFAHGEL